MSAGEDFEEFVAIVDHGSISAAADALSLPRPTLSRRLARLERRLGVRVLHRTTRRMHLTPAGEALYATAQRVVQAAREVEAEVQRLDGVPRGLLRLSVPTGVPESVFAGWIVEFMRLYPEVSVDVIAANSYVDLIEDGFDLALRAGESKEDWLVAKALNRVTLVAVASPRYLAERGAPTDPTDLAHHNCIVGFQGGAAAELSWPLLDGGTVAVSGSFKSNQMGLRLEAAKQDLGVALVYQQMASEPLSAGELELVLPGVVGRQERASLVYADRKFLDPKVRAFVDFLSNQVEQARARREERGSPAVSPPDGRPAE